MTNNTPIFSLELSILHYWDSWCNISTTLFSECLAHENHPNFLKSLGQRPQSRVILILSNVLESNLQKTPCQKLNWMKSMCTSSGEECNHCVSPFDYHKDFMKNHLSLRSTSTPQKPTNALKVICKWDGVSGFFFFLETFLNHQYISNRVYNQKIGACA